LTGKPPFDRLFLQRAKGSLALSKANRESKEAIFWPVAGRGAFCDCQPLVYAEA